MNRWIDPGHEYVKQVRELELSLHCPRVRLQQTKSEIGYILDGYGILKSNEYGVLVLEFICTKWNRQPPLRSTTPTDPNDENGYFELTAWTLDGEEIRSLDIILPKRRWHPAEMAMRFVIPLDEIILQTPHPSGASILSTLYLEFVEDIDVPPNGGDGIDSDDMLTGFSWNETTVQIDDTQIKIKNHDGYRSVTILSVAENLERLASTVLFYVGFSGGSFPQPYYKMRMIGGTTESILLTRSVDLSTSSIARPMTSHVPNGVGETYAQTHLSLLESMVRGGLQEEKLLESAYVNWKRIFSAFQGHDVYARFLVVATCIEGVYQDIYQPILEAQERHSEVEAEKENICKLVAGMTAIGDDHRKTITDFVQRWGNMHPKKGLGVLAERRLLTKKEVTHWVDMRNSSAHPQLISESTLRRQKDRSRLYSCLGLFYKLVLHAFDYDGPIWDFSNLQSGQFIPMPSVEKAVFTARRPAAKEKIFIGQ